MRTSPHGCRLYTYVFISYLNRSWPGECREVEALVLHKQTHLGKGAINTEALWSTRACPAALGRYRGAESHPLSKYTAFGCVRASPRGQDDRRCYFWVHYRIRTYLERSREAGEAPRGPRRALPRHANNLTMMQRMFGTYPGVDASSLQQ